MNPILKALVVFVVCSGSVSYAQEVATTSEPPAPGWVAYHRPNEDERRCANYSKQAWTVTLNSDKSGVLISKYDGGLYRNVIGVRDGRLVGEDNGEWGGGLWWVSKDGRRRQRLLRRNVYGFVKTSNAVLVITGLRHMGANEGDVWRYADRRGQKKKAEHLVDLGWARLLSRRIHPIRFWCSRATDSCVCMTPGAWNLSTAEFMDCSIQTPLRSLPPA